ncbi:MAG: phosphatase PAP2 family protein [Clostridiales bacterium]|jgi:undecaprenyl-diphosphatase|nr:phosphatase PAP2 family protein [Clostridiales bacterium]
MAWEADFLLYIQEYIRSDILNPVMTLLTHTGDHGILMIALAVCLLIIPRTRKIGFIAGISLAIEAILTNLLIKNIVARTRPYDEIRELVNLIENQKDYSFPSGHTGAAFAVMGAILIIALIGLPVAEKRGDVSRMKMSVTYKIFALLAFIYAALLAFSRLYVGVHYPTDVIGGVILGLATSIISYSVFWLILRFKSQKSE